MREGGRQAALFAFDTHLYPRRNDSESINRVLEDIQYLNRARERLKAAA